jgi:hypothetical protein
LIGFGFISLQFALLWGKRARVSVCQSCHVSTQ